MVLKDLKGVLKDLDASIGPSRILVGPLGALSSVRLNPNGSAEHWAKMDPICSAELCLKLGSAIFRKYTIFWQKNTSFFKGNH